MPHKHTRKGEDKSTVDLPPTIIAKPLPVSKPAKSNGIFTTEVTTVRKRKRRTEKYDDTPRAFARLMSFREGKRLPKSLDDGLKPTKKRKLSEVEGSVTRKGQMTESERVRTELPIIEPGERISDFAARVDAALPLSGLISKTSMTDKDPLGLKVARTKNEKKMHRMYNEWREQDRKIKEKRQEALELAQEEEDDKELGVKWKVDMDAIEKRSKKARNGRNSKTIGEIDEGDDDPWAALKRARNEGPRRLNDVAQAPPQFSKVPTEKLKIQGAKFNIGDVPKASGSLRRREELVEIRKSVVEGYRQIMKENRAADRHQT